MSGGVNTSPFAVASKFLGTKEVAGAVHNPAIVAMLRLVTPTVVDDETPWCSAFVNYICWLLTVKRSNSLAARSWLTVGSDVPRGREMQGFHVVVMKRGGGDQPGPEVLKAPGHVGFFAGWADGQIRVLGGNQGDAVSVASFDPARVLGVRDLY